MSYVNKRHTNYFVHNYVSDYLLGLRSKEELNKGYKRT